MNEERLFIQYCKGEGPFIAKIEYVGMTASSQSDVFFDYFAELSKSDQKRIADYLVDVIPSSYRNKYKIEAVRLLYELTDSHRSHFDCMAKERLFKFVDCDQNQSDLCDELDSSLTGESIKNWQIANGVLGLLVLLNYRVESTLHIARGMMKKCKSNEFRDALDMLIQDYEEGLHI